MSKGEKIVSVGLVILIIMTMGMFNKVNELEEKLYLVDSMRQDVRDIQHSVYDISSHVDLKLDEFLQGQMWVSEKGYEITDVDLEGNTIDLLIEWAIRDISEEEELVFLYRESSELDWTELAVVNNNGLNFFVEKSLPLHGNYETQVVAISETGRRSEPLLELNFKDKFENRMMTHAYVHWSSYGYVDMNVEIHNPLQHEFMLTKNNENLRIKTAVATLYLNDEVYKEIDLLKQNEFVRNDSYSEIIYFYDNFELGDERNVEFGDVEFIVIVEDNLGLIYETVGDVSY